MGARRQQGAQPQPAQVPGSGELDDGEPHPEPGTDAEWGSNSASIAASGGRRFLSLQTNREERLLLQPEPRSPRAAREFVRRTCTRWGLETVLEPALLVVSELVTNAVRHARTCVTVGLRLRTDHLLVEVEDSRPPVLPYNDRDAVGGRGLILIDALSRRWGSHPSPLGKVVGAELASTRGQFTPRKDAQGRR